jgi:hypothetical protein
MEQGFIDILKKLVKEQGNIALTDAGKCKAFLADYTRGEYKKESRLLLQAIEAGAGKAIDAATDLATCKQQQVRILREDYSLAPEAAADVVDALAHVLRGDTSRTQAATQAEAVPRAAPAPQPQKQKLAKPGLTRWKQYLVQTITFDTEIEITGYKGLSKKVEIPSHMEDLPVTAIGESAFNYNGLTTVTIPDSVTYIGGDAFAFNKLSSIVIPNNVTHIDYNAFYGNRLTSVIIPNGVTHIGDRAFYDNLLNSVSIPDSVTHIGEEAFAGNRLRSVSVPRKATIANDACDGDVKVTKR